MKKLLSAAAAAALIAMSLAGCSGGEVGGSSAPADASSGEEALSGSLVMTGSTSMTDVCTALNAAFMEKYPDVTVTLNGGGSGAAITALDQGSAQIGNLSRAVKDEENPDGKYTAITIALDGIAVIVNKDNPVADLTLEQMAKIFTREITNWKDLGGADAPISLIGREEGSGTRDGFEDIVAPTSMTTMCSSTAPARSRAVCRPTRTPSAISPTPRWTTASPPSRSAAWLSAMRPLPTRAMRCRGPSSMPTSRIPTTSW